MTELSASLMRIFALGLNLPENFFEEEKNNDDDFDFNQDFEFEESTRSPGWLRYQKRIK